MTGGLTPCTPFTRFPISPGVIGHSPTTPSLSHQEADNCQECKNTYKQDTYTTNTTTVRECNVVRIVVSVCGCRGDA